MGAGFSTLLLLAVLGTAPDPSAQAEPARPEPRPPDAGIRVLPTLEIPAPSGRSSPDSLLSKDRTAARSEVRASAETPRSAGELLAETPGVVLSDRGGMGQSQSISLRGASSNGVTVLLDGIPLQGAGGVTDLSLLPSGIIDHLEVLRGGGSRFGSGALGGVVNVVTRIPEEAPTLFAQAGAGSFSSFTLSGGATLKSKESASLLSFHGFRSRGDFPYLFDPQPTLPGNPLESRRRENNQAEGGGIFFRDQRRWGPTSADGLAEFYAQRRGLAGTVWNPSPDAEQESQRLSLGWRAERDFYRWTGSARVFSKLERTQLSGGSFGPASAQLQSLVGGEVLGEVELGSHLLSGSVGLAEEALAPREGGQSAQWLHPWAQTTDAWELPFGLTVSPSLRWDHPGPFHTFSPKLGLEQRLPHGLWVRANAGQSSRAPSFLELYVPQGTLLPNPSLQPERALNADLGIGIRSLFWSASAGGFYALYENLISYEIYPPFLAKPFNISAAQVEGLELEASVQPASWASFSGSYTFTHSQNLRDDPRYFGKTLPYRPAHRGFLRAAMGPSVIRGTAELSAQSQQFFNRTEALSLPGRALLAVGVSGRLWRSPRVQLSGEMRNVLNAQAYDLDGYPLPGRSLFFTLSVAWERDHES